jgi:hypothetical protein
VVIFLDTYDDRQRAYEFLINPYGIQADILRSGNNEDDSFDALFESAAEINEHGWTAEMAIPFSSIRFPQSVEQRWNILLGRQHPRTNGTIFSWTKFDRNNPCLTCQGGLLTGIRDIEATNSAELLPYVLGSQNNALDDDEDPNSNFTRHPPKGRFGGSVKYSPSPALILEGVVNPDFSQVETDADQISVNTTFALSYPEKRPFFIEGADLFKSRLQTYYSRSINNPSGAVKVTGKSGLLSYGYIGASDRDVSFVVPGEEESDVVETRLDALVNIGRVRYDFAEQSNVGGIFSSRSSPESNNAIGGLDWNYLFGGNNYLRGEFFFSSTRELNDTSLFQSSRTFGTSGSNASYDGESYTGSALQLNLSHQGREHNISVGYQDVSPTFQAQNGFVTKTNMRLLFMENVYQFYFTESFVNRFFLFNFSGMQFNYDGERKERFSVFGVGSQMKGQTFANILLMGLNQELFKGVYFENIPRVMLNFNTSPLTEFSLELHAEVGRFIYRDTPELGKGHNLFASVRIAPTSQFRLDLSYSRAQLASVATDELFYDGNIYRINGNYQFTPKMFLRVILQYNSFDPTFNVYPLFSYKVNPFTIFYAGFTDNQYDFGAPNGFLTTQRQFFVKFQYLFKT